MNNETVGNPNPMMLKKGPKLMITDDERFIFERELAQLELEKQSNQLNERYKMYIDEQIELLESVIYGDEKE